jgi:uncharacterized protein
MKIIWTEPAVCDLENVKAYICYDSQFYASIFIEKMGKAVEKLTEFQHSRIFLLNWTTEHGGYDAKNLFIVHCLDIYILTQTLIHFKNEAFKNNIPRLVIDHDQDGDAIKDLEDILEGARKDKANQPKYQSVYYVGGYPPDHEGVCTDVIWRSFKNAGFNLKEMVDQDIRRNIKAYSRVGARPDPNIDFRRVPNLVVFFTRHATVLTTKLIPNDQENLKTWQGGDVVVFGKPLDHIGIVSDIRRGDGIPYLIHNASPYTKEEDIIPFWNDYISKIIGHYRWPK